MGKRRPAATGRLLNPSLVLTRPTNAGCEQHAPTASNHGPPHRTLFAPFGTSTWSVPASPFADVATFRITATRRSLSVLPTRCWIKTPASLDRSTSASTSGEFNDESSTVTAFSPCLASTSSLSLQWSVLPFVRVSFREALVRQRHEQTPAGLLFD